MIRERFLKYVAIDTHSDPGEESTPSNFQEFDLAHLLAYELNEMGITDTFVSNIGVLYANIPATKGYEDHRNIGFITHLDTFPDYDASKTEVLFHENYDGEDIVLGNSGNVLYVSEFPSLKMMKGQTLLTTDGTGPIGVDDKAGIAELMTAMERIMTEKIPHGPLSLCFLPDEEISRELKSFEKKYFPADGAYTIDGWDIGEIVTENFNAANIHITIEGVNIFTGKAKGRMVNALMIARNIMSRVPREEAAECSDGREGFYHLKSLSGTVSRTEMSYDLRDFDKEGLERRIQTILSICQDENVKLDQERIEVTVRYDYQNMKPIIEEHSYLIQYAFQAMEQEGIEPYESYVRGGTSGAELSVLGLACPNLGTGGNGFHGPMEHITLEAMEKVSDIIVNIIKNAAL